MAASSVKPVQDDALLRRCLPALRELRPHRDEAWLIRQIHRQQDEAGYRLVCLEADGDVVAVAGYRVAHFLAWGRTLYVDDLVTLESQRGNGHGGRLMDWLIEEARRRDCDELHLDSGVQRFAAHRLYHSRRLEISSHHFSRRL